MLEFLQLRRVLASGVVLLVFLTNCKPPVQSGQQGSELKGKIINKGALTNAEVSQCVLVDTDFDIDDMMAIPVVLGNKHVAAIVTSEGFTKAELGAAALTKFISEPNQRNIPIIVGENTGLSDIAINSHWGTYVLQYRKLMHRLNNFTASEHFLLPPSVSKLQYRDRVAHALASCKSVEVLLIGTFSSFVNYSPLIETKIKRVVVMGKPLSGDLTKNPGNYSFNCEYDMPACKKAFYEQLPKFKYAFVDVPRTSCDRTPNKEGCRGLVYGPNTSMVKKLKPEGLPNTLKQILLNNEASWDIDNWPNAQYGGKTLLWDQSAALYMIHPELFKEVGDHFEVGVSPEEFRVKWTQAVNNSTTYK